MKKQRLPEQMNNSTQREAQRQQSSRVNRGTGQDKSVVAHRQKGDGTSFASGERSIMDMKGDRPIINGNMQGPEDNVGDERDLRRVPQNRSRPHNVHGYYSQPRQITS